MGHERNSTGPSSTCATRAEGAVAGGPVIERVILAVDFSAASLGAARWAAWYAGTWPPAARCC